MRVLLQDNLRAAPDWGSASLALANIVVDVPSGNAALDSGQPGRSLHLSRPGAQSCIVFRVANENTFKSVRWKQAILAGTGTAANFIHGYYE